MMRKISILFFFLVFTKFCSGQKCNCETAFEWAKKTFEENDAGFQYTINIKGIESYQIWNNKFQIKTKIIDDKVECAELLNNWLSFFRKGHLGIIPNSPVSETAKTGVFKAQMNIESFKKYLKESKIENEGIWESQAYTIALKSNNGKLEGYVLGTTNPNWDLRHLKLIINPDLTGVYYMGDYSEKSISKAQFIDGVLLNMDGIYFKKKYPEARNNNPQMDAFLESVNADKPYLNKLSAQTCYLRIPSFDLSYKSDIDSILLKNNKMITSTKNLIIDIRGNGGGAGKSYRELLPIIYTNPIRTLMWEHLSTKVNNQRWEDWSKQENLPTDEKTFVTAANKKLTDSIGEFVYIYNNDGYETYTQDTVYNYPQKIAILTDEKNASTAEHFLLTAKQSMKVKVFGNKTYGALDMSELNSITSPDGNFTLYYCLTKSLMLPDYPIDNYGIQPDFYIHPNIPQYKWVEYTNNIISK